MIKKYTINKLCVTSVSLFLILMFYLVPSTPESEVKIDKSIGDKKEVVVYLMDKDYYLGRMIEYASYDNIVDLVNKKLDILINGSDELNSFSPIIPKNTKVNSIKVDKNNIYIDFSKDILNVSKYNEELMIESIIYTITDINGIDNIYLSINKEPLKILPKSNKEIPYPLNRGYGINKKYDLDSLNNITKTTIYFNKSYDDVEYLVPITKVMNTTSEKIDIIIEELKSIVNAQYNLNSYIPNDLEVVSHDVNDDKMNLIFNEFILDKEKLVVLEEVKYAIAQSIFDNYNVKEVVFSTKEKNNIATITKNN
ncbi:germination (Cortex hydrolysis) and sporulation (Stage II multiple polar septa) lytic enzyme [Clostridium sp. CAG:1000]|jgi:spore germination protein GerM|nr:germination (Cortex hydrolysis) and sporulation (Stage II multiple polar septa) lytic enzyme [Clostridium sp. CAG:1000]